MKKFHILLNLFFVLIFIALLWSFVIACKNLSFYIKQVKYFTDLGRIHEPNIVQYYVLPTIEYSILVFFNAISLPACIILFVYCNPRLFRRSTWVNLSEEWAKNKQERLAAKHVKAEQSKQAEIAAKQKQLEALQQELSALKKDDLPPSDSNSNS